MPHVNVSGSLFTPTLHGHGEARVKMLLSKEDAKKIGHGAGWRARVTDLLTGCEWDVQSAPCGAGCHCGAVAKLARGYDGQVP